MLCAPKQYIYIYLYFYKFHNQIEEYCVCILLRCKYDCVNNVYFILHILFNIKLDPLNSSLLVL